jgi:hypothetical protein
MAKGNSPKMANGSALDFEAQLWAAADKMCGHMDASETKLPSGDLRLPSQGFGTAGVPAAAQLTEAKI